MDGVTERQAPKKLAIRRWILRPVLYGRCRLNKGLDGQGDKRDNLDEEFGVSIIGFYFVSSLLHETGWPRKQGLFRRLVVDTTVVDLTIDEMITLGPRWAPDAPPWLYRSLPTSSVIVIGMATTHRRSR